MVSKDLADLLHAKIPMLVFGQNMFTGREPSTPDNTVTLFDTSGSSTNTIDPQASHKTASVQVRVRNNDYLVAMQLIEQVIDALHLVSNMELNGIYYLLITHLSGPGLLEWDGNNRVKLIANFETQLRK